MQERLTAGRVRELTEETPPRREIVIFDTALPRFALRIKPPTALNRPWAAWYFVQYQLAGGQGRKMRVAAPSTHSLDQARVAAKAVLRRADAGGDPAGEKAAARTAWTVAIAADAWVASAAFAKKTERTRENDEANLRNHIVHRLGSQPLTALDVPAVKRFHAAVEADRRTNKRRARLGGPGAARKNTRLLSALLTWAVGEGQLARNPVIGALRLAGDNGREAVISTPAQYAALFTAADDLVAEGKLQHQMRALIVLVASTGMRRGEATGLRWGAVDLDGRRITLADTKGVKLARGGVKTETVSLPPLAADALAAIRPADVADDQQVFVPQRGERVATAVAWRTVRDRAGLPADLVLHSLRHSVGTAAVAAGMSLPEVQKLLRHRNVTTTSKYIHIAEAGRSRLQDRAMAHLLPARAPDPAPNPGRPRLRVVT